MLGTAQTEKFALGTATVMFGPPAEVLDLTAANHSVGLTKNVSITTEPSYQELTQGVKNSLVYSVMTANPVRSSFEVYEYTAKNLLYGQGLDGSTHTTPTGESTLDSPIAVDDTTLDVAVGDGASFSAGEYLLISAVGAAKDEVIVRKIVSISTDTITVDAAFTVAVAAGAEVRSASVIPVGSKEDQPFLGCKIVGQLADASAVTLVFPKVRVTQGFNLSFSSDDFQNLPFEMSIYDLVPTDPHYADFKDAPALALV